MAHSRKEIRSVFHSVDRSLHGHKERTFFPTNRQQLTTLQRCRISHEAQVRRVQHKIKFASSAPADAGWVALYHLLLTRHQVTTVEVAGNPTRSKNNIQDDVNKWGGRRVFSYVQYTCDTVVVEQTAVAIGDTSPVWNFSLWIARTINTNNRGGDEHTRGAETNIMGCVGDNPDNNPDDEITARFRE